MDSAIKKMEAQQKSINKVAGKINKVGKSITKTGKSLTKGVTAPIIGVGIASVKTAADFESGMSKVQSIASASASDMDKLRDKAIEMGAKTKFSASESADAFSYMAMAGWKTSAMLDGVEGIMYLAGATGEDLAATSDIVTDALTAFGLKASDTTRFVDVLAMTANASNTSVALMGETFKYVAPVAGSLGYKIEDTSVAIGLMANSGIKASNAGTALRSMLTNMAKPGKAAQKAMKDLGLSLTDSSGQMKPFNTLMSDLRTSFASLTEAQKAEYAASLAGKTGMSGLLAIVNASQSDFDSLTGSIANSTGAAKEMYNVANDNLNGSLTVLKSTIESISISIGDRLSPYVKDFTGFVQKCADKINNLSDEQLDLIIKIAGIAAAVGPVLLIVGKAMTTGAKLMKGMKNITNMMKLGKTALMALNPTVLIVIGVIAGLAAIAVVVYKNWDKIKAFFVGLGDSFKQFIGKMIEFVSESQKQGNIFGAIFTNIGNFISGIKQIFTGLIAFISGVFTGNWKKAWEGVKSIFSGVFGTLASVIKQPLNGIIGLVNMVIGKVNGINVTIPDWVPGVGGKSFGINIPTIPFLYKGTNYFSGGSAFIHDKGAEIVDLPRGTRVIPHDRSLKTAYKQGQQSGGKRVTINKLADTIIVRNDADIDAIAEALARKLEETADNTGDLDEVA